MLKYKAPFWNLILLTKISIENLSQVCKLSNCKLKWFVRLSQLLRNSFLFHNLFSYWSLLLSFQHKTITIGACAKKYHRWKCGYLRGKISAVSTFLTMYFFSSQAPMIKLLYKREKPVVFVPSEMDLKMLPFSQKKTSWTENPGYSSSRTEK